MTTNQAAQSPVTGIAWEVYHDHARVGRFVAPTQHEAKQMAAAAFGWPSLGEFIRELGNSWQISRA